MDGVPAGVDEDVRAGAAIHIDRRGFLEKPDAHLEAEVIGGEGADGADVGGIEGVIVIEATAGMDGEGGVGAALGESEHGILRDFIHEADTTGTHDAALVVEPDARADINVFRFFHLHVHKAGYAAPVADGLFLEAAFAGLVADGAVEGMVDEEKFHDTLAAFFHQLAGGADPHVFRDHIGARDHGAGQPADGLVAVSVVGRFLARGEAGGHTHLNHAHAAVPRDGELGVVAVIGNVALDGAAGFNHPGAFWKLIPSAVDLDVYHAFFSGDVFGQSCFRG